MLDTGGQYCHLIARRIRELGVYADVQPSDVDPQVLANRRGVIVSGGPASVYEAGSPTVDAGVYSLGKPVLGICYGLHLMARELGGKVERGVKGEYGRAVLRVTHSNALLDGFAPEESVWMSHRDLVSEPPSGFELLADTDTCPIAAIGDAKRRLYGVQFHPEVVHTARGMRLLENFLFRIVQCERDWDPKHRLPEIERQIRERAGDRNVMMFASGGVDSTVAFALCLRALGPGRVHAAYVDTGLMREGETAFVRDVFERMAPGVFEVVDASKEFLSALQGATDPETKRHIVGEEFVRVQERILERGHFLDGHWILGQGTIYPDTIESGGTKQAETIKTHHNRVAGIQKLIVENRIVEPLHELYKDEVRILGRTIGLPDALLDRHPYPGPGLAIRCLCSDQDAAATRAEDGVIIPVKTVGVQGDSRTYRAVLALPEGPSEATIERATESINRNAAVNRVIALCGSARAVGGGSASGKLHSFCVAKSDINALRLDRLRRADAIVRELSDSSGFEKKVWQFPVVLIPFGTPDRPDSVVLRPIYSVDGMTASAVPMEDNLLRETTDRLLEIDGVAAVFFDLTHKPPATIEWE